jgi:hypothetical protein
MPLCSDRFLSPPHMEGDPYLSFPHNPPVLHTIIKVGVQTPYASPGKIKILPLHRDISLILVPSPLPKTLVTACLYPFQAIQTRNHTGLQI